MPNAFSVFGVGCWFAVVRTSARRVHANDTQLLLLRVLFMRCRGFRVHVKRHLALPKHS